MRVVYRSTVAWPHQQPKTKERKYGQYGGSRRYNMALSTACNRVVSEVKSCTRNGKAWRTHELVICVEGARHYVNGSGFYADSRPTWPGVAVQFDLDGEEIVLACDTYADAAQNLCAIAATIEDLRRAERNGVLTLKQMLGAQALPEPCGRSWWLVLQCDPSDPLPKITEQYRKLSKERHPDLGGSIEAMSELNAAMDEARRAVKYR